MLYVDSSLLPVSVFKILDYYLFKLNKTGCIDKETLSWYKMKIYPVTLMLKATLMTNSVIDAIPVFYVFNLYAKFSLFCF